MYLELIRTLHPSFCLLLFGSSSLTTTGRQPPMPNPRCSHIRGSQPARSLMRISGEKHIVVPYSVVLRTNFTCTPYKGSQVDRKATTCIHAETRLQNRDCIWNSGFRSITARFFFVTVVRTLSSNASVHYCVQPVEHISLVGENAIQDWRTPYGDLLWQ